MYLAQDILQDVYIVVLKNIHTLKNPRLFISWLNQINFRMCYDVCQKHNRYKQELQLLSDSADLPSDADSQQISDPEKEVTDRLWQSELMSEILSLHPNESQTIIMRYYNDMSLDEIADAMNCSRSAVKRRLAKGKRELEKKLGDKKGDILYD